MLIAISTYLKPLSEVDLYVTEHRSYLRKLVDSNKLLICGRQSPPVGGVLVAKIASKEEFLALLKEDPFMKAGVAEYKIIEFKPLLYDPKILPLLEHAD